MTTMKIDFNDFHINIRVGVISDDSSHDDEKLVGKLKTSLNPFQIYPLCKGPRHVDRDPCGISYRPLCIYLHPKT